MEIMTDLETFDCHECGAESRVVQGDYSVEHRDDGTVAIYEITMHGSVEVADGDTLAEAFRDVANQVEQ